VAAATRPSADLAERVLAGDRRAIGRAISVCENADPAAEPLVAALWPHAGRAATVGLTGPPGVGKSTLAGALVGHLRSLGKSVGVIAIDPSSPFTRGALLGDRIRMSDHFLDPEVFIRSMGTRGHLGGVAEATFLAMLVLDAAGKDVVVVETVGVGQSEVEVRSLVDVVSLVLQPGSGDSIQAIKAGLMEIPDVICLNKRDHPAAAAARRELHHALALGEDETRPLVVEAAATEGEGIPELWDALEERRERLGPDGLRRRRRENLAQELVTIAAARSSARLRRLIGDELGGRLLDRLDAGEIDPVRAVAELQDAARDDT
jgi:LAO/AO transport system kinase